MSRVLAAALLAASCLFAGDPPAVEWNKDTVTATCPGCTAELPLNAAKCPACGAAVTWKDLAFDDTPAGAFVKFKYALKYQKPELLETCVSDDLYDLAEGEGFRVDGGPLTAFLHAKIRKVDLQGDAASVTFAEGEGAEGHEFTFSASRAGGPWRIGLPPSPAGHDIPRNEALARRDLLLISAAERAWRDQGLGAQGHGGYWTRDIVGLWAEKDAQGKPLGLIRRGIARADSPESVAKCPSVGAARATHGYHYRMVAPPAGHAPFGGMHYAVCAWPDKYAETGRLTLLLSDAGAVLEKDLGPPEQGAATAGVAVWPASLENEGWKKVPLLQGR